MEELIQELMDLYSNQRGAKAALEKAIDRGEDELILEQYRDDVDDLQSEINETKKLIIEADKVAA